MLDTQRSLTAHRIDGYLEIGEYAAIGDGRTLALVGSDGSIDWMCLPELDSPSVFGGLLDPERGDQFVVQPSIPFEVDRRYIERTNVLETTFRTAAGTVQLTDALTLDKAEMTPWRELVRMARGCAGEVPMRWQFAPRFQYGAVEPGWGRTEGAVVAACDGLQLGLQRWGAGEDDGVREGGFRICEGEQALFAMTAVDGEPLPLPQRGAVLRRLEETVDVWRTWVGRHTYDGPWRPAVERSLLTIRLLTDGRCGAITAAGTTSLPEVLGGERNYDYRFGWVRDASFTLDALLAVGIEQPTHSAVTWLLEATRKTSPRIDPVYRLAGQVVRAQHSIPLPGYRRTAPVNVGNQAGSQLQLGGFGDLLETIHAYVLRGHLLPREIGERLADAVDLLCLIWRSADAGLWELPQDAQYGTSKLGCWVAVDRLLELVRREQAPARHVRRWVAERDAIAAFIERELYSTKKRSYVQKAGSDALDCGMLLAARRGFGDPRGERIRGTIDAIASELDAGRPLLYRYSGMREEENAFLACSFWLVQALAYAGRGEQAAELMDTLVALGNDVGLYAEEMEPGTKLMRGNFPQALTHLSLINAAVALRAA